jgi:hypothetical protein
MAKVLVDEALEIAMLPEKKLPFPELLLLEPNDPIICFICGGTTN